MGEDLAVQNEWREKFAAIPRKRRYLVHGTIRIGSQNTLEALANNEDRILLTATGTGKQCISDSVETVSNLLET
jgi:hypothetical protein